MGKIGKVTRRAVLATGALIGGGLAIGVAVAPNRLKQGRDTAQGGLNTWVKISPDNQVTVIVPHSEMGQGSHTALAMMLADELDADWSLVAMEQAPATSDFANSDLARAYVMGTGVVPDFIGRPMDFTFLKLTQMMDVQNTGGSSAVSRTGEFGMRRAGAAAKAMLLTAAADQWNAPVSELQAANSIISHPASGRSATYGQLADAAAELTPPLSPTLKTPDQFTIMGQPIPRLDIPAKVDGTAVFGIDVDMPGMLYGAILQSPVFGGTVASVDAGDVEDRRGIHKVVALDNAVVVVADSYWRAEQALMDVKVTFDDGPGAALSSEKIYQQFSEALASEEGETDRDEGNVGTGLTAAATVVEAQYKVPFLAHATMEPMNCTAHVTEGACEIWVGHQNPLGARRAAAEAAGLDVEKVTVHNTYLGGGFGRRSSVDFVRYAVDVSKAVGAPVKLVWSREQDIRHDFYRPAVMNQFKAGLDRQGKLTSWSNLYTNMGANEPAEAALVPYDIPNQLIAGIPQDVGVPIGPWRSVGHTQHAFFNESFVDELAHAAGKDPYAFRRDLLAHAPRHLKVLDLAAEKAGWGTPLPPGHGRGIAIEASFGSIAAEVAEVSVTPKGALKVLRVTAAVDCGRTINPGSAEIQIQSGIIYGLTAACYGEISIENGRVQQSNFPDYEMIRLASAPRMEVHFIDSGEAVGGLGEPGTPPVAPAVANAIFAVTGKRIRSLPLLSHDLSYDA